MLLRNFYANTYGSGTIKPAPGNRIRILYSGTIARTYGIFAVIEFISRFHERYPEIELVIAGYSPHRQTLEQVKKMIASRPFISLTGGENIVPHERIIEEIRKADFGIIRYELNPAVVNCFPTKIYEYMGNGLPMLIQEHPSWSEFCLRHQAALVVDFKSPDYDSLIRHMKENRFYPMGIPGEIDWKQDEPKLLDLFDRITKDFSG